MANKYLWAGGAVGLAVLIFGVDLAIDAGSFRKLEPKSVGACRAVIGAIGAEDLTIDARTGVTYLSAYDRRAAMAGPPTPGGIFAYDLKAAVPGLTPLTPTADASFLPHGISLYQGEERDSLFVINHGDGRHSVEIFDVTSEGLEHRRTVTGAALVSPNDLVAVGPDAFYVTNDHGYPTGFMRTLEDYLRLKQSTVHYFDGTSFTQSLAGIGGANGINGTPDGKTLYLSAASENIVYVYDRDEETGALTQTAAIDIEGFPDNIEVSGDGSLLIGVHSKIFQLLAHFEDNEALSPSHIVRVTLSEQGTYQTETIYYNDGTAISGASVAAEFQGRLIIGPIFEPKFLDCRWSGN